MKKSACLVLQLTNALDALLLQVLVAADQVSISV